MGQKFLHRVELIIAALFVLSALSANASSTDGTIDSVSKYAWGENTGWLNFAASSSNVHVSSTLTGYIWSDNYGWINLSPAGSGVTNDASGNLSGSAWGQQTGYINFSGVVINSSGVFTGMANGSTTGRVNFDCSNCRVLTDWRPAGGSSSPSPAPSPGSGGGGGGSGYISPPSAAAPTGNPPATGFIAKVGEFLKSLIPQPKEVAKTGPVEVPKIAPPPLRGEWNLIVEKPIGGFALAPLPQEFLSLVEKFPKLRETFRAVGISREADLSKLLPVELSLPGLAESVGLPPSGFAAGVPLADLSADSKKRIPTEIVFVRSTDEKVDLDVKLGLANSGAIEKKIKTVVGSKLNLAVRPEAAVNGIKGYVILRKSGGLAPVGIENNRNTIQAALTMLTFSAPAFAAVPPENTKVNGRLALAEFEYTDPDGDGIYTADVKMPKVDGEYDILTVISYKDPALGTKELNLIAVVDPEGYIYEKQGSNEVRISKAEVSLYWLNPATKNYKLWPGNNYSQTNPQITDVRGTYAFLVPPGSYYLVVKASGYGSYVGAPFTVAEGNELHFNIELHSQGSWNIDWKTLVIVVMALLVALNFYFDRRRNRMR